jgi:hypothetical protein
VVITNQCDTEGIRNVFGDATASRNTLQNDALMAAILQLYIDRETEGSDAIFSANPLALGDVAQKLAAVDLQNRDAMIASVTALQGEAQKRSETSKIPLSAAEALTRSSFAEIFDRLHPFF